MALTNLLSLNKNKGVQIETFLALEINEDYVKAAVWVIDNGQVKVLKTSEIVALEEDSVDALLQSIDMAIATAIEEVETEPEKVIYGLLEDWVDEEGLVKEKKEVLKYLSKKLELQPIGYVVVQEALITYLKNQQGTPPTAIFIKFNETELLVTLVQLGKIYIQEKVGRSENLVADVNEGLKRFKDVDQLPARIILYNSHIDFEDIKQQLLDIDWEKELPFLHTPKIESLEPKTSIKAVAIAGGSEAAKSLGIDIQEEEEEKEKKSENLPEGFVVGQENQTEAEQKIEPTEPDVVEAETSTEEDKIEISPTDEVQASEKKPRKKIKLMENFSKIKAKIPVIKFNFKKVKKPDLPTEEKIEKPKPKTKKKFTLPKGFFKNKKSKFILIAAGFLILTAIALAAGFWFYWNVPKADITLYLYPKNIDKKVSLTLSKEVEVADTDNFIAPAFEKEIIVKGQETVSTTGTDRVGEQAKGRVLIYNKTKKTKSFSKGTVLVGSDNLRFELAEDIEIASSSAQESDEGEQITYGKAEAEAIAGALGSEYNLSAGSEFGFKDLSKDNYSAKAVGDFSGGSSEEVQVVSKADRQNALEAVEKKLAIQAKKQLEGEIGTETVVISDEKEVEIIDSQFDQEIGAEASTVTVDAEIKVITLYTKKSDFDLVLMQALAASVPENFAISSNGLQTELVESDIDETGAELTVDVKAKLMPKVNFGDMKRNIVGKYPNLVEDYFKSLPNFVKTRIEITPSLPGQLGTLPRREDHIFITIEEAK